MSLVSNFLIERLENIGVKHIFGVVGGHNNNFIENINNNSKIKFIANKDGRIVITPLPHPPLLHSS